MAFALALAYGIVTPLGEGPDEPAHLQHALFIASAGRLPGPDEQLEHPGELHQPPLAYLLLAPALAWLPDDTRIELGANPRWSWAGGAEPAAYMRRTAEREWSGLTLGWHLARMVSAVLGAGTAALTALLGRRLGASRLVALAGALLLAALPQFGFQHGLVSNDPLLWLLSVATLVWVAPGGPRDDLRWGLGLGALLGAVLLTKASAVMLLPVAALGLWLRWRSGALGRPALASLVALATALALSGWWFWGNLVRTGDPWALEHFRAEFATQPFDPTSAAEWRSGLRTLLASLVARFGWVNLHAPSLVFWLAGAVGLAGTAGGAAALRRGRPGRAILPAGLLALLALGWVGFFVATVGHVGWQGRFLFPALPPLALALAWGLSRVSLVALELAVLALALTSALLPTLLIAPAYPTYTSAARPELPTLATFASSGEPGLELREAMLPPTVEQGAILPIRLTWHALGRPARSWAVFIHLTRPGFEDPLADVDAEPLDGRFPMVSWTHGDWVVMDQGLNISQELAPGIYDVRVGLFDMHGDQSRPGAYRNGQVFGDKVIVGQVEVLERRP